MRPSAPDRAEPITPILIDRRQAGWQGHGEEGAQPSLSDLELLAHLMDSVFRVPGLPWRFGLDALLGLIPGLGDTATSFVSLYILHTASRRGVSRLTMTRMAMNIAIDYAVGAVPFVGDVFDVYWKSNQKNVALLRREAPAGQSEQRRMRIGDWLFFLGLAAILLTLLVGSITIAWLVIAWLGSRLFPAAS